MFFLKVNKYDFKLFVFYLEYFGDMFYLYGFREGSKVLILKLLLVGEFNFVFK